MTDADLLRDAAAKMRQDADTRWHPVADWLDEYATWRTMPGVVQVDGMHNALTIARAYLGRDA